MIDSKQFKSLINDLKTSGKIKNQRHLAEIIGIHEQKITDALRRGASKPDLLVAIHRSFPGIDIANYVDAEYGKLLDVLKTENAVTRLKPKGIAYYNLDVSAGPIEMFQDESEVAEQISIPGFQDCDIAINVWGDSMYPHYRAGNMIICKEVEDKSLILFGEVYLVITQGYRTIKYLKKHDEAHMVILRSANDKYDDVEVGRDSIIKLYHVKGKIERNAI